MKSLAKYMLLILGGTMVLSSCDDFLDKQPLDSVTPNTFFYTENDIAAYAVKHYDFSTHSGWGLGVWASDNGTDNQIATSYDNKWIPGQWRTVESYSTESNDPWYFNQIRELNYALEIVIPRYENNEISGSNAGHYIGELLFLRAKAYFDKLQTLGDFPIVKTTLPDEMEALTEASKRQPRNKVARFIIEDLDNAINNYLSNTPPGGKNRITKNAALLLKSRVALFEASWLKYHSNTALVPGGPGWPGKAEDVAGLDLNAEITYFLTQAKDAAKQVIANAPLSENTAAACTDEIVLADEEPYKMNNPYFAQFSADNMENYSEILLWRSYNLEEYNIVHSAPFYLRVGGNSGFTRQFVETFLCRDGKPIYNSPQYKGDGSLLDVRKNRDLRLQLFMMRPDELLTPEPLKDGDGKPYDDTLAVAPNILDITEKKCVTGYQMRKGLSNHWYRDGNTAIEGSPVYRSTEAYLNYIEASALETDGRSIDADAEKYWGDLRERAGLPRDYRITVSSTELDKESDFAVYSHGEKVTPLMYCIRRERRCELMEEGFRMNDLRRWRALDQVKGKKFWPEGVNLWESELKDMYKDSKTQKSLLISDESSNANVSSYTATGKYLSPYRIVKVNNLMYESGYSWCEAHYLTPISIKHFRITSSGDDLSTSTIYQNPGWPLEADQAPKF